MECWGTEEEDEGDPPRLWAPNATYPGTAFTRSFGDSGERAGLRALTGGFVGCARGPLPPPVPRWVRVHLTATVWGLRAVTVKGGGRST